MRNILSQLKAAFSLSLEGTVEEREANLNRLFCLTGALFTPIVTFAIWSFQSPANRVVQFCFTLFFLLSFILSFTLKSVKNNLKEIVFTQVLLLCIYACIDTGINEFSFQSSFGLSILLFIAALIISTKKHLAIFYTTMTISLAIVLYFFLSTEINKQYLAVFFAVFIAVGFILTNYKINIIQRLTERESFLQTIFDQTYDAVFLIDYYSKKITDCNQMAVKLFEVKEKKEIIGYKADRFDLQKDESKQSKGITRQEKQYITAKKNKIWADVATTPLKTRSGKFYVIRITDITDIKRSQQELEKSESNYRNFVQRNLAGVYRTDMDRTMLDCNDAMAQIFGYSKKEDIIGKNAEDLYSFSTDSEKQHVERLMKTGSLKSHESKITLNSGKEIWIIENTSLIKDEGGTPEIIEGTILDITEIKETSQALKESEKRMSMMLQNIDEVVYNIKIQQDGSRKIEYISPQVSKVFGYTQEEFNKGKVRLSEHYHEEDRDKLKKELNKLQNSKQPVKISYRFKHIKTNKHRWIEESIFPMFDEANNHIANFGIARDITKEREAEQTIKENEERYRTIVENAPETIVIYNYETSSFVDCNKNAEKLFGYPKQELLKMGPWHVSPELQPGGEKSKDLAPEKIKKALKGNPQRFEWVHTNKDGKEFPCEVNLTKYSDKDDKLLLAFIVDISERKKSEEVIKNSEARLRLLSEETTEGIVLSEKGKIFDANQQFARMHGYTRVSEVVGMNIKDFVAKKDHKKLSKSVAKKEIKVAEEYVNVKKDGKEFYAESRGRNFTLNGKEVRISVVTDITERVEYEREKTRAEVAEEVNITLQKEINERIKAEKQLIENQQFTQRIIDSSLDMICATDKEGRITEFNKAAEITSGYKKKELLGKPIEMLYEDKKERRAITKELIDGKGAYIGEVVNKRKNGETFLSYLSASVLKDQKGKTVGMMSVSRDISNIKEAEAELKESEERYRDLFENATDLIHSANEKGEIVYVNNAWKQTLGYEDEEIKNRSIYEFIHPDSRKDHQKFCESWFTDPYPIKTIEVNFITKDGQKVTTLGSSSAKISEDGHVTSRTILKDVTEQKQQEKLQHTYDTILDIIATRKSSEEMFDGIRAELRKHFDAREMYISYYNGEDNEVVFPYFRSDLKKKNKKRERKTKRGLTELVVKTNKPYLLEKEQLKQLIEKEKLEVKGKTPESLLMVPLQIEGDAIGAMVIQSYENKNAYTKGTVELLDFICSPIALTVQRMFDEEKINDQAARLHSIIESATNLMIWTIDRELEITSYNQICEQSVNKHFGIKVEEGVNFINMCKPMVKEQPLKNLEKNFKSAFDGKPQQFEGKGYTLDGRAIWLEIFLNPIYKERGKVEEISCMAVDITEKKEAEEKLKSSLEEKSVLLKEVHHRVKNNLQVISSILNLQSSYVKDENTLSLLRESQDRIKSMSFIHESLYQTKDLSKINFSDYILNLSQNLVHSYQVNDENISLNINIDRIYLNIDQAIPCGLITNELVSNALKYAFPKDRKGSVDISIKEKDSSITMQVGDNGVGLPKNFDINETETLGLQLVTSLVEQLNGEILVKRQKGTTFIIKFDQQKK